MSLPYATGNMIPTPGVSFFGKSVRAWVLLFSLSLMVGLMVAVGAGARGVSGDPRAHGDAAATLVGALEPSLEMDRIPESSGHRAGGRITAGPSQFESSDIALVYSPALAPQDRPVDYLVKGVEGPQAHGLLASPTPSQSDQPTGLDTGAQGAIAPEDFETSVVAPQAGGGSEIADRLALLALYIGTGGPTWRVNTNWLSRAPLADWYGIDTNEDGRVISVDLPGNGLIRTMPSTFGASGADASQVSFLPHLEYVNFESNQLRGNIPAELGLLYSVRTLILAHNDLEGEIPAELANLTNLEELSLGGSNQFTGCIPAALQNIPVNDLSTIGLSYCSASTPEPVTPEPEPPEPITPDLGPCVEDLGTLTRNTTTTRDGA